MRSLRASAHHMTRVCLGSMISKSSFPFQPLSSAVHPASPLFHIFLTPIKTAVPGARSICHACFAEQYLQQSVVPTSPLSSSVSWRIPAFCTSLASHGLRSGILALQKTSAPLPFYSIASTYSLSIFLHFNLLKTFISNSVISSLRFWLSLLPCLQSRQQSPVFSFHLRQAPCSYLRSPQLLVWPLVRSPDMLEAPERLSFVYLDKCDFQMR